MDILWKARKRWTFFGIPWTFTVYSLREDKILVDKGFFTKIEDEIMLYRVLDISIKRGFIQRIFGLGTITVISSDKSCSELLIQNIKHSKEIKEQISELVEKARDKKRVYSREIIDGSMEFDEDQLHNFL